MRDKRSFLIVLDLLPAADDFSLALVLLFFKQRVSKVLAYGSNFFAEDFPTWLASTENRRHYKQYWLGLLVFVHFKFQILFAQMVKAVDEQGQQGSEEHLQWPYTFQTHQMPLDYRRTLSIISLHCIVSSLPPVLHGSIYRHFSSLYFFFAFCGVIWRRW